VPAHPISTFARRNRDKLACRLIQAVPLRVDSFGFSQRGFPRMHFSPTLRSDRPLKIAVVGTGIAGMSAAWLLSGRHQVTIFEKENRVGGHSNTVSVEGSEAPIPVDTGFIVYNEPNYPNLVALFDHLGVPTRDSDMSFAASVDDGGFEYSSDLPWGLIAQKRNLLRPRFWRMIRDIRRFYGEAAAIAGRPDMASVTLGDYLDGAGYSDAFVRDHLLPMAAAIWSTSTADMRAHPLAAFIRFWDNHGLLNLAQRPVWRTVDGGSREYVRRLTQPYRERILAGIGVARIHRGNGFVRIIDTEGCEHRFDQVIVAAHADEALAMLAEPTDPERALLGAFRYVANRAVLHSDTGFMPRRRAAWASWNYIGRGGGANEPLCVTYWMNRLQGLDRRRDFFVTLNPDRPIRDDAVITAFDYHHPFYDREAIEAQRRLWSLQGVGGIWYCGSYWGAGFHEDALQSGLAAAEAAGGVQRPWSVPEPSGRICLAPDNREAA